MNEVDMTRRARILLDVDGVSADFVQHTLNTLVRLGGPQHCHEDITTWNIFGCLPQEYEQVMFEEWCRPGWCSEIPLYPGALEGIQQLREHADIVFVTTAMEKAPHWMYEREQWLKKHFNAGPEEWVFTAAKQTVCGDLFADDKASAVIKWAKFHPNSQAVLWDSSTNKDAELPAGIPRVSSWEQLLGIVRGLK